MTAPIKPDEFVLVAEIHDPDLTSSLEVSVRGIILRYRRKTPSRRFWIADTKYSNALDPLGRQFATIGAAERVRV